MPRQFTTPILLPADPTSPLHASTKQYVDTGNTSLQRTKQPSAARWTDWRTRAVGTQVVTGTLGDDGTAFLVSPTATETATIANNRLEVSWPNSTGGALYLQQPLNTKVRRIGATFGFGPSANTTSAAVALATWDTPSPQASTNAQIHLAMTASSATFGVVVNGSVINLVNWAYFTPLAQDYTVYHAEVTLVGSTAFVALPDGQSRSITDSRIASINGTTACWEFFRDANTTTAPIAFQDTWASGSSQLGGATSYGNVARRIETYRSEVNTLLNAKAPTASPTFTGTVTVPDPPVNATDAASKNYIDTNYVSQSYRGPRGGIQSFNSVNGTFALPFTSEQTRWIVTGDVTVNVPTSGIDGQQLVIEAQASGASRTITFSSSFETAPSITSRVLTVASGFWVYIVVINRGGTYRIESVDVPVGPTAVTYGSTVTLNCALGTRFYTSATGNVTGVSFQNVITDGLTIQLEIFAAGGASRTFTTGATNLSGKTLPFTIASGRSAYATFIYSLRSSISLVSLT